MEGPSAQCVLDLVLAHPFGIRHLSNYMISAEPDLKLAQPNPSRIYECPSIDECLLIVPRPKFSICFVVFFKASLTDLGQHR